MPPACWPGQARGRLRNRVPSAIWAGALQAQNSVVVLYGQVGSFQIMAAEKDTSKSALDRKKQALRDNLKRRKGALRGIAAADEEKAAARPKARHDALRPRQPAGGPDSGTEN